MQLPSSSDEFFIGRYSNRLKDQIDSTQGHVIKTTREYDVPFPMIVVLPARPLGLSREAHAEVVGNGTLKKLADVALMPPLSFTVEQRAEHTLLVFSPQ